MADSSRIMGTKPPMRPFFFSAGIPPIERDLLMPRDDQVTPGAGSPIADEARFDCDAFDHGPSRPRSNSRCPLCASHLRPPAPVEKLDQSDESGTMNEKCD